MTKSSIELSFQCSKKWEILTPITGGRFCSDCNKTVTDFSKIPLASIDTIVPTERDATPCGHFHAYQLDRPFGDWRDKIISFYQTVEYSLTSSKISRQFTLMLLTIALIATGCHRHVRGKFRANSNCGKKKHHHTEQTTSSPKEQK